MHYVIIFIIVALLLYAFIVTFWQQILVVIAILAVIGGIWWAIKASIESEKKKEEDEERRLGGEEAKRRRDQNALDDAIAFQKQLYENLERFSDDALTQANAIPRHLEAAEKHLDEAKVDFEDGALSPFWDSIEDAINEIGYSNNCIINIDYAMSQHAKIKQEAGIQSASFPLKHSLVSQFGVTRSTTDRLNKMVRTAQCSPDFAKIYETKRQSQILIAGFSGLGLALRGISEQIETSIEKLGDRIEDKLDEVSDDFKSAIDRLSSSNREDAEKLQQSIEGFQKEYRINSQNKERQFNDIQSKINELTDRPRPLLTTNEKKKDWIGNEWSETTILTDTGEEIKGIGHKRNEADKNAASKLRRPLQ